MNTTIKLFIFFTISILLFSSCKNDLNINAPYKEIPSVYAILTPQEPIQMIRINKVFLGDGNANVMAKVPDSVNYQPGDLTVMLERYYDGVKTSAASTPTGPTNEVIFRDSVIQTEEGAFATTQRVYVTNLKLYSFGIYKLTIKNNKTGKIFTAQTNAIDSVAVTGLPPFAPPYYPVAYSPSNTPSYYVNFSKPVQYIVRTKEAKGAFIHDLTIRLHYYDSLNNGVKNYHSLDYGFFPKQLYEQEDFGGNKYFVFRFNGSDLFLEYANMLAKQPNPPGLLGRRTYKIDLISYAATQEYYDYLQFASPSLSFAQEKILYSNFDNKTALGLFTFRTRCLISKHIANEYADEFAYNKYTCGYRFYTSALTLPGCP